MNIEELEIILKECKKDIENTIKINPLILEILSYFECKECSLCCKENKPTIYGNELVVIMNEVGNEIYDALEDQITLKSPCKFILENRCRIYKIRPTVCSIYPFSLHNFGFITLILRCSMGKDIQKDLESYMRSVKEECRHDRDLQKHLDKLNRRDNNTLCVQEIAMSLDVIPKFLEYLKNKYEEN